MKTHPPRPRKAWAIFTRAGYCLTDTVRYSKTEVLKNFLDQGENWKELRKTLGYSVRKILITPA